MRHVGGFDCRYHMEYTRGVIEKGSCGWKLSEFPRYKVAAHQEISKKKLGEGDIPDRSGVEIRDESVNIDKHWESSREEDEQQMERPLLTSQEWSGIETGTRE